MPSRAGARVAAAKRMVRRGRVRSVYEYLSRLVDGERWCAGCQAFVPLDRMAPDPGRPGGIAGRCVLHFVGRNKKEAQVSRDTTYTRYDAEAVVGDDHRSIKVAVAGYTEDHTEQEVQSQIEATAKRLRELNPGMSVTVNLPWHGGKMLTATAPK